MEKSQKVERKCEETSQKKFKCTLCDKECSSAVKLKNHVHFRHNNVPTCDHCGKTFLQRSKLLRHAKIHTKQKNQIFHCPLCDFTSSERKEMLHHYTLHNYDMTPETLSFNSSDEFHSWLDEIAKITQTKFINTGIAWVLKGGSKCIIYKCHRDGFFSSRGRNIRRHLSSNKINGFCPASIKAITTAKGAIEVTYLKTHVGHTEGDGRVPLKDKKISLVEKLNKKIPIDSIFDSIKESLLPPDAKAMFLSKKKIINIASNYGLYDYSLIKSDYSSFDTWIETMMSTSLVHFCKPVGSFCVEYPSIKAEDFLLVIMTESQKVLVDEFGCNYICIDKVQGVKKCDYQLISLSVLDNLNQGFPCAFFLTNREDSVALEIFFIVIRNIMNKKIVPNAFISDLDDIYYNTWSHVMGRVNYKLYSPWAVDRLWRDKVIKVEGKENQVEIYKKITSLMFETNVSSFESSISTIMNELYNQGKTRDFATFLEKYYVNPFPWAQSHWFQAGLNSNVQSLENIHFILHQFYTKRKKVQIDVVLTLLLKYIKDKLFEQMILWNNTVLFHKLIDLKNCHLAANGLSCAIIEEENGKWFVTTVGDENSYVIRSLKPSCACSLKCKDCDCCIHKYDCTCQESSILWQMCKHVHFLNLGLSKLSTQVVEVSTSSVNHELHPSAITTELLNSAGVNAPTSDPKFNQEQPLYPAEEESWHSNSNNDIDWSAKQEDLSAEFNDITKHILSEEAYKAAKTMIASLKSIVNSVQP